MAEDYKLSFDYYLEYAVVEQRDYLCTEQVFASRDVHEAFREMLAVDSDAKRTLQLLLKDPEGQILYHRVLAQVGKEEWICQQ